MKVGTDAFMLGAWVKVKDEDQSALDIGCGSGIISLMLAQRSRAFIDAIDVHQPSVEEAAENFNSSPWPSRLMAIHSSLEQFAGNPSKTYDLIVSNPPFFQNSMLSASENLSLAKHNVQLSLCDFLKFATGLLKEKGRLCVILPVAESKLVLADTGKYGLFLCRKLIVVPKEGKLSNRVVLELSREDCPEVYIDRITLRNAEGKFTEAYKNLTHEFHPRQYF
ncbi:MAG: tRNA1(Val) (adenine(37)-N6)-methyltransferase [Bacteroidales bacterium]